MTGNAASDESQTTRLLARIDAGETLRMAEMEPIFPVDRDRFGTHLLGLQWGTFHRDRVTAAIEVSERHHQPFGITHGGVWAGVVEAVASVGGLLRVASRGQVVVGVNNSTDFFRPHQVGRVDAIGIPVHVGTLQQLWLVELSRSADGKPIARGQVRLHNLDHPRPDGG